MGKKHVVLNYLHLLLPYINQVRKTGDDLSFDFPPRNTKKSRDMDVGDSSPDCSSAWASRMWAFADEPLVLWTATAECLTKPPWLVIYPGEILEELLNNCKPVKNLHTIFTFIDPARWAGGLAGLTVL